MCCKEYVLKKYIYNIYIKLMLFLKFISLRNIDVLIQTNVLITKAINM